MHRREFLQGAGVAAVGLGLSAFPAGWTQAAGAPRKRVLFFTRSQGYEHAPIKRTGDKLGFAEQIVTDLGAKHAFDVVCTKDGAHFTPENIASYDAFLFYTTGDLTKPSKDGSNPMTPEGKAAFLEAIHAGKGFVGTHSATDTFHPDPDDRYVNFGDKVDPYIAMLGGEFIHHDAQQDSKMLVIDPKFPGFEGLADFTLKEEWYSLKDFRKDLHVLLVQETKGMTGPDYLRPPYPATWARRHGRGHVFYTSMGHREDVWTNPMFQQILLGGLAWAVRNVRANVTPNIEIAAPHAWELPAKPTPKT